MPVADRRSTRAFATSALAATSLAAPSVGVGFKPEHFEAILSARPAL